MTNHHENKMPPLCLQRWVDLGRSHLRRGRDNLRTLYHHYHRRLGNNAGSTDGPPEQAEFNNPQGTAVDKQGNVYVVEYENHAVRKITPDGVVSTFAGVADESGSADGKGSDARFSSCYGAGVGPDGYIYVADTQNDTIRKISRTAIVTPWPGRPASRDLLTARAAPRDSLTPAAWE